MDVALLNERVTFQKNEAVVDDVGNHRNVWTDYYACSATIGGEGWHPQRKCRRPG